MLDLVGCLLIFALALAGVILPAFVTVPYWVGVTAGFCWGIMLLRGSHQSLD